MRILALLFLFFIGNVQASIWYTCPAGSGAGATDGSSVANCYNGFADITWGGAGVVAGDTLRVISTSGTYYERLVIGVTGTSPSHVTITGWDPTTSTAAYANIETSVDISGDQSFSAATTYVATGYPWTLVTGTTDIYKKDISAIPNIVTSNRSYMNPILGSGLTEAQIITALTSTGMYAIKTGTPNVLYVRLSTTPALAVLRMNDHRNDGSWGALYCTTFDYIDIRYLDLSMSFPLSVGTQGAAGLAINDCENITIDYVTSHDNLAGFGLDGGVNITLGSNVRGSNNRAVGLAMEATPVALTGVQVSGTYNYNNRAPSVSTSGTTVGDIFDGDGIGIGQGGGTFSNIVIDGFTSAYNGAADNSTDQGGTGVYVGSVSAMSASVSVKRGYIDHNHGCGIHLGAQWTGGIIAGNIVRENVRGQTTGTCLFSVWVDMTSTGGTWLGGYVVNNTIEHNYGTRGISFSNGTLANTLVFKNNIVSNNNPAFGSGAKTAEVVMVATESLFESNNIVYSTSGNAFFRSSGFTCAQVTSGTWGAASALTGDNDTCVDPLFVGNNAPTVTTEYNLKIASTARRAGASLNIGNIQDNKNQAFHFIPSIGAMEVNSGDVAAARTARN